MANGRCESEPIPCDVAAGSSPRDATSMVISMGRNRSIAPFWAAASGVNPRARNWLIYSTMITPVWTDTPNNAKNPTPEDTLKFTPDRYRAVTPPTGAIATLASTSNDHFIDENI